MRQRVASVTVAVIAAMSVMICATGAISAGVAELKSKFSTLDMRAKAYLNVAKTSNDKQQAEEAAYQWYYTQKDVIAIGREIAGQDGVDKARRDSLLRDAEEAEEAIDAALAELLTKISNRVPPEIIGVSAMEIERSGNYVTYSIAVDVKNEGESRDFFITVSGLQYDNRAVDDTIIRGVVEQGREERLTGTLMVKQALADSIRDWKATKTTYYKIK